MMISSRLRLLTAVLALTAAGTALASCGSDVSADAGTESSGSAETSAAAEAVTEAPDALDLRRQVDDELGDFDFGGKDFRVYITEFTEDFWMAEESNGDILNDAVLARNRAVEERFNVKIRPTQLFYEEMVPVINESVMAGDDIIDLISGHAVGLSALAPNDRYCNWYSIPHIDFSKPWWSPSNTADLTCSDVCLAAIGDAAMSALSSSYCVFYNRNLGVQYDLPDMFGLVESGAWTIDRLVSLTKDIYSDLNANGEADNDDLYGYTSDSTSNINAYLWAFDNPVFKKKGDTLEFSYKTEKLSEMVPKIISVFHDYPGIHTDLGYKNAEYGNAHFYSRDMFARGLSVFANGYIGMSLSHFRDLADDFSILPYPKWDEAQENYHTMADGLHEVLLVPLTVSDPEYIGVITEALCAESYRGLVPAYYDVALKVKGARDPQSVEMLDRIVASRVFDFGYIYDGFFGCSFVLQDLFSKPNLQFESFFAKRIKHYMKQYDMMLSYFESYSH